MKGGEPREKRGTLPAKRWPIKSSGIVGYSARLYPIKSLGIVGYSARLYPIKIGSLSETSKKDLRDRETFSTRFDFSATPPSLACAKMSHVAACDWLNVPLVTL